MTGRCACRNPVGLRCNWDATGDDTLCDACRMGLPVMGDGKHWCQSASTEVRYRCCDHCRSEDGGCDWNDRHHAPCHLCSSAGNAMTPSAPDGA